jgi:hypothetical protein
MKIFFAICGFILVLMLSIATWFYFHNTSTQPGAQQITFPTSGPISNQQEQQLQPVIKKALLGQIQNSNQITLKNAVVVMPYALQAWGDSNKGGDALLRYDHTNGWILVSMGGGAWDVPSLIQLGVPQDIAAQLVTREQ